MSAGTKRQAAYWTRLVLGIAAGLLACGIAAGEVPGGNNLGVLDATNSMTLEVKPSPFSGVIIASRHEACRIRVAESVVDGLGVYGHGTGVPVAEHIVATARHVVESGKIEIEYRGTWYAGELVAGDKALDVALVRVAGAKMKSIKLADEKELTVEASDKGLPVSTQVVRPNCSFVFGLGQQGNSGAPVMRDGRLIGIVTRLVVGGGYEYADVAAVRRLLKGMP